MDRKRPRRANWPVNLPTVKKPIVPHPGFLTSKSVYEKLVLLAQPRPYRAAFKGGASVVSEVIMHLQKIDAESSAKKNPRIIPRPHW